MSETVLLLGAGGHARACIDVIEASGNWRVAGLVGLADEVGRQVCGYPVLGTDADLERLRAQCSWALITVGQIKSPDARISLYESARTAGYRFATVVSPKAHVSRHATVGAGTIVMHGAVVNAGASVGANCIVNTAALVEHDAHVDDHCHVSTMAVLNSGVKLGSGTFLGSNACVRQGVTIGRRCVIGMGERVLRDCPDETWLPRSRKS